MQSDQLGIWRGAGPPNIPHRSECFHSRVSRRGYPEVSGGIPRIRSHILHSLLLFNSRWWVEEWRKTRAGKNKKLGEKRRNGRLKGKGRVGGDSKRPTLES